jgi:hypothetical protein
MAACEQVGRAVAIIGPPKEFNPLASLAWFVFASHFLIHNVEEYVIDSIPGTREVVSGAFIPHS